MEAKTRHILGLQGKGFHNSRVCPPLAALGVHCEQDGIRPELLTPQCLLFVLPQLSLWGPGFPPQNSFFCWP